MNAYEKPRFQRSIWLFAVTIIIASAIGFSTIAVFSPALAADDRGKKSEVVKPSEIVFGKSYEELAAGWVNWIQKEPPETSPAFDTTGVFCELNQRGKFWYLAGTFSGIAERRCEVPAGKAIFFPIINFISFAPEFPEAGDPCASLNTTVEQVRCDVNEDINVVVGPAPDLVLRVVLDGNPVADPFAYRVQSRPGGFVFQSGPLFEAFGITSGPRPEAVLDGYWILLRPLKPGIHQLSFSADSPNLGLSGANFTLVVGGHR